MSFIEDAVEDSLGPILIGAGVLVAAPILFPVLAGGLRPVAKRAVRAYLAASEKAREIGAEAREQWSDLVAEAQADAAQSAEAAGEATAAEAS